MKFGTGVQCIKVKVKVIQGQCIKLTRAPLGGGQILPPPLSNIRDNLRTTQDIATKLSVPYRTSI